jgi:uncharacterized protein YciI
MAAVHQVVFHLPGPEWVPGLPLQQQVGVQEHKQHYAQWLAQGKLELGGPFLDAAGGGMMVACEGVGEDELRAFAQADPTVVSRLLRFEIRPWFVAMRQ